MDKTRRGLLLLGIAVTALTAMLGAARAAGPPIQNLAPTTGSFLPLGTSLADIHFTCPAYEGGLFSDNILPPYRGYEWRLAEKPTTESNGLLSLGSLDELGDAARIGENECEPYSEHTDGFFPRGTYYFQANRPVGVADYETGPILQFSVGLPPNLPGRVKVYLACGLEKNAKPARVCVEGEKVGAFYRSAKASVYEVCAFFTSSGEELCSDENRARAGVLYVNKVTAPSTGPVLVKWKVLRGKTLYRHVNLKKSHY